MSNIVSHYSSTGVGSLYALLVGIDDYPNPRHGLEGCKNDVEEMGQFLEEKVVGKELQIRKLLDDQATKINIIEAFLEMKVAKPGDVCLFYFSGHGSKGETIDGFRHLDFNGRMESIVCYDSRLPKGTDLVDKELSHLTWELSFDQQRGQDKGVHLVMIFDCCHAGGTTKEIVSDEDEQEKERAISNGKIPAEVSDFYGFPFFGKRLVSGGIQYTPLRGPHIHLAAAKGSEKAKERWINGKKRGLYSYHLLSVLRQHELDLTYAELHNSLSIRLLNDNAEQTPQWEHLNIQEAENLPFLLLFHSSRTSSYVVNYHKKLKKWVVNMGHIHGLDPRNSSQSRFFLSAFGQSFALESVYLSHSALKDLEEEDQSRLFRARLVRFSQPKMEVGIDPGIPLFSYFQSFSSPYFSFVQNKQETLLRLAEKSGHFSVFQSGHQLALHTAPKGINHEQANDALNSLEKIAKWSFLKGIRNDSSRIKDSDFTFNIWRQEGPDAFPSEEEAPKEKITTWEAGILFQYQWGMHFRQQRMKWLEPAIRLTFNNTSGKTLYIAGLYFQADYKITDRFCEWTEVPSGTSYDFQYRTKKGRLYKSIFLNIYNEMQQKGISQITEQIKLFISYHAFDVQSLKQEGLFSPLVRPDKGIAGAKGIGKKEEVVFGGEKDWRVVDVKLIIQKDAG